MSNLDAAIEVLLTERGRLASRLEQEREQLEICGQSSRTSRTESPTTRGCSERLSLLLGSIHNFV